MKPFKMICAAMAAAVSISMLGITASAEWVKTESGTKYTDGNDNHVTGWQVIDGNKYYFNSNGILRTGWIKTSSGKRFYSTFSEGCATGWKIISGKQYYFNSDGSMRTGWIKAKSGRRYYMDSNGIMVTAENYPDGIEINGKVYKFDVCGVWDGKVYKTPSSSKISLSDQRAEALAMVRKYQAEYDDLWAKKEADFKVRDRFSDYADFLTEFMDVYNNCKALVPYTSLSSDDIAKINTIVADVVAENGKNDTVYWKKLQEDDFYYAIYKDCNTISKEYNTKGTLWNLDIEKVLAEKNKYVSLYNDLDNQIKAAKKQ